MARKASLGDIGGGRGGGMNAGRGMNPNGPFGRGGSRPPSTAIRGGRAVSVPSRSAARTRASESVRTGKLAAIIRKSDLFGRPASKPGMTRDVARSLERTSKAKAPVRGTTKAARTEAQRKSAEAKKWAKENLDIGSINRRGKDYRQTAKDKAAYEKARKEAVKGEAKAGSRDSMRAVTKRGGTKPYSKMGTGRSSSPRPGLINKGQRASAARYTAAAKKGRG